VISQPYGMIVVSGPTGSGKSTSLYASLKEIKSDGTNITTVEDPVEYQLDGINQVQTHDEIGLSFSASLRSIFAPGPRMSSSLVKSGMKKQQILLLNFH